MEKKKTDNKLIIYGIILFLVLLVLWFFTPDIVNYFARTRPIHVNAGSYGDLFGYINSLFSGLALFAVIVTLYLQMKEFKLTREEMALSRQEFIQNRKVLDEQAESMKQSALLNATQSILDGIRKGREIYQKELLRLENSIIFSERQRKREVGKEIAEFDTAESKYIGELMKMYKEIKGEENSEE